MVNLDPIFRPKSIALIGASDSEHTINHQMLLNLFEANFRGPVYPVNPKHKFVHGIRAYPSVEDIPDEIDLAIIIVPKEIVPNVVDQCGRKGVKGLIVITAGFKEIGADGQMLELELVKQVKSYGMRMIGPNCFGVMNLNPDIQMNATFTAYTPTRGELGFISQSGALGEILIDRAEREGLGMSMFSSVGNKADINGNEILEYWEDDDSIKAILLYLENIGSPRRFSELAREISRKKPIITLKAGVTQRGAAAASSHTGALADQEAANTAIFEQYGVISVSSVDRLFEVSSILINHPPIKGRNVCVITNAGGPAILQTDALITLDMNVPDISEKNKAKLRKVLRPEASLRNPIDLIASGGPDQYRAALEAAFSQDDIHSVITMFIPVVMIDAMSIAEVIAEFNDRREKPMLVVWLASGKIRGEEAEHFLLSKKIPIFEMPLDAARALQLACTYYEWLAKPIGKIVHHKVKIEDARKIIHCTLDEGRTALADHDAMDLLDIYKIPTLKSIKVNTRDEALEAASKLCYPVVLKASKVGLMHKSDFGGVELGIEDPTQLMDAYTRIDHNLKAHKLREGASFLVQPMIGSEGDAIECVLGLQNLKKYGPMVMFGMGGIYVEILKAVGFRMVPMTDEDARELIMTSPAWPILKGARGKPGIEVEAVVDAILRLSQLAWENPEILSIDLNPFMAFPDGSKNVALDQVIMLAEPEWEESILPTSLQEVTCKPKKAKPGSMSKKTPSKKKSGKK